MPARSTSEIFNGYIQSGMLDRLTSAYKRYGQSGEKNTVQAPQLLQQALGSGIDESIIQDKKNDAKVSALMTLLKMSELEAIKTSNLANEADVSKVQSETGNILNTLASYKSGMSKESKDRYSEILGQVAGIDAEGKYTTFGIQTSYDIGQEAETSMMGRIGQQIGDMSLIAATKRGLFGDRKDEIERAVSNEVVRRGIVKPGVFEQSAGIAGGLVMGMVDSYLAHKTGGVIGGVLGKQIAKTSTKIANEVQQNAGNITRYLTQGAALPVLQSVQDQAGLTEKYDSDNSGYLKLLGDAAQNVVSMAVGDRLVSPLIKAWELKPLLKSAAMNKNMVAKLAVSGSTKGEAEDALRGFFKVKDISLLDNFITEARKGTELSANKGLEAATAFAGDVLSRSIGATIASQAIRPVAAFLGEGAVDIILDIASTSALAGMNKDFVTVHQKAMFDIPSMMESGDMTGALQSVAMQRLAMRIGGRLIGATKEKSADIFSGKPKDYAGTEQWLKNEFAVKMSSGQAVFSRLNNMLLGNDIRDIDAHLRSIDPDTGLADFIKKGDDLETLTMTWFYNQNANNRTALGIANAFGLIDKKWKNIDKISEAYNRINSKIPEINDKITSLMSMQQHETNMIDEGDLDKLDAVQRNIGTFIASKITNITPAIGSEAGKEKWSLDEKELGDVKDYVATAFRGFGFENDETKMNFANNILKKVEDRVRGLADEKKSLSAKEAGLTSWTRTTSSDIVNLDQLKLDKSVLISIDPEKFRTVQNDITKQFESNGVKWKTGFSKDNAMSVYRGLSTVLSTGKLEEWVQDIDKDFSLLNGSKAADFQNIKEISEILKSDLAKDTDSDLNKLDSVEKVSKMLRVKSEKLFDYYNKQIQLSQKRIRDSKLANPGESGRLLSYTLKLLNLVDKVGINENGRKVLQQHLSNRDLENAINEITKQGNAIGDFTQLQSIKDELGANGFATIISRLIGRTSDIALSKTASAIALQNGSSVDNVLNIMNLSHGDSEARNVLNWAAVFGMNVLRPSARLDAVYVNDKEYRNIATRFMSLYNDIINRKDISTDDMKFALAVSRSKQVTRDVFSDGKAFDGDIGKDVVVSVSNGKVSFNVKINEKLDTKEEVDEAKKEIVTKSFGAIQSTYHDVAEQNIAIDARVLYKGDMITPKEMIRKLQYGSIVDIDIKESILHLAKVNANDMPKAVNDVEDLVKQCDPAISDESARQFANQTVKEAAFLNSIDLSATINDVRTGLMKDFSFALSNQRTHMDNFDNVFMINVALPDEFMIGVGSDPNSSQWNVARDVLARKGIHEVLPKGNTLSPMFAYIAGTEKNGKIPAKVMLGYLKDKLNYIMNSVHDSKKASIENLIKEIGSQKTTSVNDQVVASVLEKYAKIKQADYTDVKEYMESKQPVSASKEALVETQFVSEVKSSIKDLVKYLKANNITVTDEMKKAMSSVKKDVNPETMQLALQTLRTASNYKAIEGRARSLMESGLAAKITELYERNNRFMSETKDVLSDKLAKGLKASKQNLLDYTERIGEYTKSSKKVVVDHEFQSEVLQFMMFGDAVLHEDHITKRSSYSNSPIWFNNKGNWVSDDVKKMFVDSVGKHNIVLASLGGDGDCYAPDEWLRNIGITTGTTMGKVVHNSVVGGMKLNYFNLDKALEQFKSELKERGELSYTDANGEQIIMKTEEEVDRYLKDAIIIDVSAYKTIMPSLSTMVNLKPESNFQSINNAFAGTKSAIRNVNDQEYIAKVLAHTTLHSATETFTKDQGRFGMALDNVPSNLNQRMSSAHTYRLNRLLKNEVPFEINDLLDPVAWSRKNALNTSILRNDVGLMAKVSKLKRLTSSDSELYSNETERMFLNTIGSEKSSMPSCNLSADIAVSCLVNMPKINDPIKKSVGRQLQRFWNDMTKATSNIERQKTITNYLGGYYSAKADSKTQEEMISNANRKIKDIVSKNPKATMDEVMKIALDNVGKETMNLLAHEDENAMFQKYRVGEGKGDFVYMLNATRFPHQRVGDNYMLIIKGIHTRDYSMEISDYHFSEIMQGDYDGDAIQVIGLSRQDYLHGLKSSGVEIEAKDDVNILKRMNNDYNEAVLVRQNSPAYNIKGYDFVKHFTQPGTFVSGLNMMPYWDWMTTKSMNHKADYFNDIKDMLNTRWQEFNKDTKGTERILFQSLNMFKSNSNGDKARRVTFMHGNPLNKDYEYTHTLENMIQSQGDKSMESRGINVHVMTAKDGAGVDHFYLMQSSKANNFWAPTVIAEISNVGLMTRTDTERMFQCNALARHIAQQFAEHMDADNLKDYISDYGKGKFRIFNDNTFIMNHQMMLDTANGIGVNNMKENTLAYFITQTGTGEMQERLSRFIKQTTVSLNVVSAGQSTGDLNVYNSFDVKDSILTGGEVNKEQANIFANMQIGNQHQRIIDKFIYDIEFGNVRDGMTPTEYKKVVRLFSNTTPDPDEHIDGLKTVSRFLPFANDDREMYKFPMQLQVGIKKLESMQNYTNAGMKEITDFVRDKMANVDLKQMFQSITNIFGETRQIYQKDVLTEEEFNLLGEKAQKLASEKVLVKAPAVALYQYKNNADYLGRVFSNIYKPDQLKKVFKVCLDANVWMKSTDVTDISFMERLQVNLNKIDGGSRDIEDVEKILSSLGLRVENNTSGMLATDAIIDYFKDFKGDIDNEDKVKLIKEAIKNNPDRELYGFKLVDNKNEDVTVAKLGDMMISILGAKNINDKIGSSEAANMYKVIIALMDLDQQRILGLTANGINESTVNHIDYEVNPIGIKDLVKIEDMKRKASILSKLNVFEESNIIKNELNDKIIEGC